MTDDAPSESSPSQPPPVEAPASVKPVERLFPFVLRARALLIGRETLRHSKSKLHFVLITRDISASSRTEILSDFAHYPVVQHFMAEDLERHFNIRGAKVIGFAKSGLAQSIYAELKQHRINQPVTKPKPASSPARNPTGQEAAPNARSPGRSSAALPHASSSNRRRPPERDPRKVRPWRSDTRPPPAASPVRPFQMAVGPHRRVSLLTAVLGLQAGLSLCYAQTVRRVVDVAPVWSGHPVGFHSLVASNRQFVAFYDAERQMTLAMRSLPSTNWTFIRLPERVGWDSHNYVTAALDASGHLHVSGNLHVKPLVYFRTERPLDITTLKRVSAMTGRDEQRATYPRFFTGPRGELIFTYRNGASGNGDQIYNVYAPETRTWQRLLDQPLLDGEGRKNAYLHGPNRGPDGFFHLCWIWRETPVCSTSHYVCYARSRDLVHWETSESKPLELPITFKTAEVIDPVPIHGGAINGNVVLGFDAQKRPIVSYHKFDPNGFTQVYNARLEAGGWRLHQATDWEYRWDFSGGGSIEFEVRVGAVTLDPDGQLIQRLSNKQHGSATWVLDEHSLKPLKRAPARPRHPASLANPTSTFPGMTVHLQPAAGNGPDGVSYWLRWETLGPNRDRPRSGPLPSPSPLQVYEISANRSARSAEPDEP